MLVLAHDKDQSIRHNRFSEEQIIGILNEHEAGVSVADLYRKHCASDARVYKSGIRRTCHDRD
jgi:putative transposase